MEPYRVAIIGCGRIGNIHAKAYAENPLAKLVAFSDIDRAKAEEYRQKYAPDASAYDAYETMLREVKPDVVSVCLWAKLHLPVVRACAEAGVKAVHCEKPMAPTWREAREIMPLAHRVRLTFNHQRRFTPSTLHTLQILRSGELGVLRRIEAFIPRNMLDWGTHIFDLVCCFNHDQPAKWVMAQVDTRAIQSWFGIPFENQGLVSIRFHNGVHAIVHAGEENEWEIGFRLHCDEGLIEMNSERQVRAIRYGGVWREENWPDIVLNEHQMRGMMQDLLSTLRSGELPLSRAENALRATELIFAAYESARRRARVDLPLVGVDDHPLLSILGASASGAG